MAKETKDISIDSILQKMNQRHRLRKTLNIVLCLVIVILGTTAVIYKVQYEGSFFTCFREMTFCSTVLTVLISAAFILLNLYEIRIGSEVTFDVLFYLRLSSAVTGFIVLMITLIGCLPFISDHPVLARYDMINMHVIVPVLKIVSFIFNDSPIGKVSPWKRFNGLIILTIYTVLMITLILTNVIPEDKIPYSFLDVRNQSIWFLLLTFCVAYGVGYFLSWLFIFLNRKLSWLWYKGVTLSQEKKEQEKE